MKYFDTDREKQRLRAEERLVFYATELVCEALAARNINRTELATRLGVTPGEITQRLNGERNLTLRTLADMLDALGFDMGLELVDRREQFQRVPAEWSTPRPVQAGWPHRRYTTTGQLLQATG